MSAGMGLIIPCVLLLLNSGVVFAYQIEIGAIGGSISFKESIPIQANPVIIWNFKNAVIAQRFPGGNPACDEQYAGRCDLSEDGTLRLDKLSFEDEGNYTIRAQYLNNTLIKQSVYGLQVYDVLNTPLLTRNGTSNDVISGTYLSLQCNAHGQTVSTYTFYHDGKNICSEPNVTCKDSDLHFQPITESNSGNYTCTIHNPVSSNTSNTLALSVSVPVSGVKVDSNITGLVWPGLDSVSLTCSARGTNVSYSWSIQGAPLPPDPQYHLSENNMTLIINHVTEKDHGPFACTASNWINSQTSNGVTFDLAYGVSNVTLASNMSATYIWAGEESVSLHCSANGSQVTFLWKLNGQLLPADSRYHLSQGDSPPNAQLLISPVSKNDNGTFTCEVSNRLGSKTSNGLILNLAWVPEGNINCTAQPNGQSVTLGCSWPGGEPAANVSLNFSNQTSTGQNNVNREVSADDSFLGSSLTCKGYQLGRTSNCSLLFSSPTAPPGFDNNTITSKKVGESITLTVILERGLPAQFNWSHPKSGLIMVQRSGKLFVESTDFSSTLQIESATLEDAGIYECKAKNWIGSETFLFTVDVSKGGLDGGAIAGIVIGVLAAVTLIGILIFFLVKKKKRNGANKRINEPEDLQETSVQYATVQKKNGGVVEKSLVNDQQEDDVKYAVIKFPNNNSQKATVPPPVETEYSTIKPSNVQ